MLREQRFAFVCYLVCRLFLRLYLVYEYSLSETEMLNPIPLQPMEWTFLADTGRYTDISWDGQPAATTCANIGLNPRRTIEGGHIEVGRLTASDPLALMMPWIRAKRFDY